MQNFTYHDESASITPNIRIYLMTNNVKLISENQPVNLQLNCKFAPPTSIIDHFTHR